MSVPRLRGSPAASRSPLIEANRSVGTPFGSATLKAPPTRGTLLLQGLFCLSEEQAIDYAMQQNLVHPTFP